MCDLGYMNIRSIGKSHFFAINVANNHNDVVIVY